MAGALAPARFFRPIVPESGGAAGKGDEMSLALSQCGAVLLAGGRSRRMGVCKARLVLDGQTMLERTLAQLTGFSEVLLSANDPDLARGLAVTTVPDCFPDCGPLAGLHAALSRTKHQALFCVPCDLPYFTEALPRLLLEAMPDDAQALLCRDSTGRIHPLCGIYRKTCLPHFAAQLTAGNHRVLTALDTLTWHCFDTAPHLPDTVFLNMNTPGEYRKVTGEGVSADAETKPDQ